MRADSFLRLQRSAGPVLIGLVIDLTSGIFDETHGYQAMWPAVGLPVLASIPLVVLLRKAEARAGA